MKQIVLNKEVISNWVSSVNVLTPNFNVFKCVRLACMDSESNGSKISNPAELYFSLLSKYKGVLDGFGQGDKV